MFACPPTRTWSELFSPAESVGVPAGQNSIGCLIEAISLPPPLISINSPAWPDQAAPACLQMLNYACHMKTKPISSPPHSLPTALSLVFAPTIIALFMLTQSRRTRLSRRPAFPSLIDDHRVKFGVASRQLVKGVRHVCSVRRKLAFVSISQQFYPHSNLQRCNFKMPVCHRKQSIYSAAVARDKFAE